ncbi:MAG TPA: twin-arginine translocation signal domain-containing protein, partial [Pyrinomonadaceae bacterium]
MKTSNRAATDPINNGDQSPTNKSKKNGNSRQRFLSRRAFLGRSLAAGAGTIGVGLLGGTGTAEAIRGGLTPGDAALLRFPAALELLEADFWIQYNELGGIQDDEVPGGSGNPDYTEALEVIEDEMGDYIHDNTDDEITHHQFLNAYLVSHGAPPANLEPFRTLMGSTATGVNSDLIGHRLTNLTQLTIDTS